MTWGRCNKHRPFFVDMASIRRSLHADRVGPFQSSLPRQPKLKN